MPAHRLTPTMTAVLTMARDGRSLYSLCFNRSDHGARTCSIKALRRRGFLAGDELTEQGREALAAQLKRGF